MGKKVEGFLLKRIRAHVRVQPPTTTSHHGCSHEPPSSSTEIKGRRIMVVVDSCSEAKNALLWTLSHCAQPQDSILLLHFLKAKQSQLDALATEDEESCNKHTTSKAYQKVSALKIICELKRPEVKAEMVVVEGAEKGPTEDSERGKRTWSVFASYWPEETVRHVATTDDMGLTSPAHEQKRCRRVWLLRFAREARNLVGTLSQLSVTKIFGFLPKNY